MDRRLDLLVGGRRLPPRPPSPDSETKNYLDAELYCFLCRTELPWSSSPDLYPLRCAHEFADWETDVIALFDLITDSPNPAICAYRTKLSERNFFSGGPLALKNGKGETQYVYYLRGGFIDRDKARSDCHPIAMTHVSCWKMVRKSYPDMSFTRLYQLALNLLPILPEECRDGRTEQFDAISFLQPEHTETSCDRLISRCARLPQELQRQILNLLPPGIVPSLITSFHLAHAFLPQLSGEPKLSTEVLQIPRTGPNDSSAVKIRAATINILGFTYLKDLRVMGDDGVDESSAHCIAVNLRDIRSARFVLGTHGISAIRFGYEDGSSSLWLGELSEGWHGVVRGDETTPLSVLHDGLKVIRLGFETLSYERTGKWADRAIWDTNPELLKNCDVKLLEFSAKESYFSHYRGWRMCQYFPLEDGPFYATGLTAYVGKLGVTGVVVHGKIPKRFGDCSEQKGLSNIPRHFALQPGERITSMWLHTPLHQKPNYLGSNLLVATDQSRSAFFGADRLLHSPWAEWTSITTDNLGVVTGLFFDIEEKGLFGLHNYGAAVTYPDPRPVSTEGPCRPPLLTTTVIPPFLREFDDGMVTIAKLSKIVKIHTRKVDNRCKGMYIFYQDETMEALGRWDPSDTEDVIELYEYEKHGRLKSVGFSYEGVSSASSWVTNIVVNQKDVGGAFHTLLEVEAGKMFAWEFTYDYDNIREWEYETMTLPQTSTRWAAKTLRV